MLSVVGVGYVSEHGKAALRQVAIMDDRHIVGLRHLVQAAHDHGAAIAAQIANGGINQRLLGPTDRVALAPSKMGVVPRRPPRDDRPRIRGDRPRLRRACFSGYTR